MDPHRSLKGLRVLVTRPAEQAESMCRLLANHGAQVERLPMQAIEPVRQPAAAARALQQARDARVWIFTSANAVRYARGLDAGVWPPCVAVGPATAAALAQAGIETVLTPPTAHDSDGVLSLAELQDVRDSTVVLVTGEGGRDAIESGLAARGARVERIEVYRRVALPHDADAIAQAVSAVDAAVVTNGEALRQLVARVSGTARDALLQLQLVVPSRRVVELASELGFKTPALVPEQIADAGFLHSLERWWESGRRDARMTEDKIESPPTDAPPVTESPAAANAREHAAEAPPPTPASRRGAGSWLPLPLLLLIVAALGFGGWRGYRHGVAWVAAQDARADALAHDIETLGEQFDRLQTRLSDQSAAAQRLAAELARVPERLQAQDAAIGALREELGGGRLRVQLTLVEQLLLLANDRVQVARDVVSAVAALDAADARLVALKDPRLFEVRQAIAAERAALQAVEQPDLTGAALVLSGLIARAPRLPLASQAPTRFEADAAAAPVEVPAAGDFWTRAWIAVKRVLASVFSIRRTDGPPPALLDDSQIALIRQVLALKLEAARVALLQRDSASFRELCTSSAAWLDEYFHAGDPAVGAARAELVRMQSLQLQPPLPDVSRSLALLRAQLDPELH